MRLVGTLVVFLAFVGGLFWAYSSGWIDSFSYKTVIGNVGGDQAYKLSQNEFLHVFDLVDDDGSHINVGFDYDNFSLKEGLRAKITFVAKPTYSNGLSEATGKNVRVQWHKIVEYQILTKEPVKAEDNK